MKKPEVFTQWNVTWPRERATGEASLRRVGSMGGGRGAGIHSLGTGRGQEPPWEEETAAATGVWALSVGPDLVLVCWLPGHLVTGACCKHPLTICAHFHMNVPTQQKRAF